MSIILFYMNKRYMLYLFEWVCSWDRPQKRTPQMEFLFCYRTLIIFVDLFFDPKITVPQKRIMFYAKSDSLRVMGLKF